MRNLTTVASPTGSNRPRLKAPMSKGKLPVQSSCSTKAMFVFIVVGISVFFLFHAAWFHSAFERIESPSEKIGLRMRVLVSSSVAASPLDVPPTAEKSAARHIKSEPEEKAHDPVAPLQVIPKDVRPERELSDVPFDLPGAAEHAILKLSDHALSSTPVSVMMSWYGEANGGGSCAGDFGNQLVARWRATRSPYCPVQGRALGSSIDCYLVRQTRHHGNGDNLCHMKNVAVNLKAFADESVTTPVIERYVHTQHMEQPYVHFAQDFIVGDCQPNPNLWQGKNMPGWNADLTTNAFTVAERAECDVWVEHPVLLTQRDTFANFFHDSEDFVNVFLAMAILEWSPGNTQHFLTDLYPEGPFWDMWKTVYTHDEKRPTLTAWDLRRLYGSTQQRVCFKDLAVGIYGPAAPITVASWDTPCSKTALVRAYADFVTRSLGLQGDTHYAQAKPLQTIRVTYMARRASTEWPEKKFCNDTHSFFKCRYWDKFGIRQLGRMIRNDQAVVQALRGLEAEYADRVPRVQFVDADYNRMSFREQVRTDLQTDLMIGPHGAGLMHSIFLPDRGMLMELSVDGSGVNRHFHNLALWAGKKYRGDTVSNPVDVPHLLRAVRNAIDAISLDKY